MSSQGKALGRARTHTTNIEGFIFVLSHSLRYFCVGISDIEEKCWVYVAFICTCHSMRFFFSPYRRGQSGTSVPYPWSLLVRYCQLGHGGRLSSVVSMRSTAMINRSIVIDWDKQQADYDWWVEEAVFQNCDRVGGFSSAVRWVRTMAHRDDQSIGQF